MRLFDKPGKGKGKVGSKEQQQEGDDADDGETVAESGMMPFHKKNCW